MGESVGIVRNDLKEGDDLPLFCVFTSARLGMLIRLFEAKHHFLPFPHDSYLANRKALLLPLTFSKTIPTTNVEVFEHLFVSKRKTRVYSFSLWRKNTVKR